MDTYVDTTGADIKPRYYCDPCTDKGIDDQSADHFAVNDDGDTLFFCRPCFMEYVQDKPGYTDNGRI